MALLAMYSPENIKALRGARDTAAQQVTRQTPIRKQTVPVTPGQQRPGSWVLETSDFLPLQEPVSVSEPVEESEQVSPRPECLTLENLRRLDQETTETKPADEVLEIHVPECELRYVEDLEGEASEEQASGADISEEEEIEEENQEEENQEGENQEGEDDSTVVGGSDSSDSSSSGESIIFCPPYHPCSVSGRLHLATLRRAFSMPADKPAAQVRRWLSANLSVIRHVYFGLVPQPDRFMALGGFWEIKVRARTGQWIYRKTFEAISELDWESARIRNVLMAVEPGLLLDSAPAPVRVVKALKSEPSGSQMETNTAGQPAPVRDSNKVFRDLRKTRPKKDTRTRLMRAQDARERIANPRPSPLRQVTFWDE